VAAGETTGLDASIYETCRGERPGLFLLKINSQRLV